MVALISRTKSNYTDLDLDFLANPVTGDISKKIGPEAVKRSIRNIVLTMYYERGFESTFGGNVLSNLFKNFDVAQARVLATQIENAIKNYESRANLLQVDVTIPASSPNEIQVTIIFSMINVPQPITLTVFLQRVR